AFMVADKVTVISRPAGDPQQGVRWESEGQGEFTVETVEKPARGTDVILHLKEDAKEFLDEWRLRQLVKRFSNFIEHPVVMDVEQASPVASAPGEKDHTEVVEETLNAREAIWLRQKREVKPEEYSEFYKQLAGDSEDPARVLHYAIEGAQEYKVLLFVPSYRPFDMDWGETKVGPRLYVQRVLIMDHC